MFVYKLTERMSKSCRLGIFNHLRRKCFVTLGSAWKMASGMALMEEDKSIGLKCFFLVVSQSACSPQALTI